MTFEYWLVIVLDSEEIFEACLTEEEAQAVANNLKNNASWDVTIEKVELTKYNFNIMHGDEYGVY